MTRSLGAAHIYANLTRFDANNTKFSVSYPLIFHCKSDRQGQ